MEEETENEMDTGITWGFPKIRGPFLGVPIIRTLVFWGPSILGNYHLEVGAEVIM